jgi:outer membrane lipase/esterase
LSDKLVAGLGFTVGNQEATPNISSFESSSFGLNGLMGYRDGRWFADASLGLSVVDYDSLKRSYQLGSQLITAQGDTSGFSWGLDTSIGYNLLGEGAVQLAPAIGLQWLDNEVDGYTETGGEVSNYEWSSLSRKSMQWRLGFVGQWQVTSNFDISAEIFAAEEQEDGRQNLQLRNTNLAYNSFQLPGFEPDESSLVTSSVTMMYQKQDSQFRLAWNFNSVGDGFSQLLLSYSRPL